MQSTSWVGFSSIRNGTIGGPYNILEASQDFDRFLEAFFTRVFPKFAHQPLHIAGESFGGKTGDNEIPLGHDKTTCRQIEGAVPQCEHLNHLCKDTYEREVCGPAFWYCFEHIMAFLDSGPVPRDGYDDRAQCVGKFPHCGDRETYGRYLNDPKSQELLGVEGWNFSSSNSDMNERWLASKDAFLPTTRELR
ncbi:hypothetical protein TruAng_012209 [Truncatella angustata]|nr:hypothetical protein TruAng_012209 [Truncatella angustata]